MAAFAERPDSGIAPLGAVARLAEQWFDLQTDDGTTLRCCWSPAPGSAIRGQVLLLQGRAEFIEKYHHVVAGFRLRGLDVLSFDWRGQGGSRRQVRAGSGHVEDFDDYGQDLATVLAEFERRQRGAARFAVAHSLGAALLLMALCRSRARWDHVWLVGPMLGIHTAPLPWGMARALARIATSLGLSRCRVPGSARYAAHSPGSFEGNPLTTDRHRYQEFAALLDAHPQLAVHGVTFGWIHQAALATDRLRQALRDGPLQQPMTIFLGDDERVVRPEAVASAMKFLPQAELLRLAPARHEVLMETPEILDRFWQTIEARLPGDAAPRAGGEETQRRF